MISFISVNERVFSDTCNYNNNLCVSEMGLDDDDEMRGHFERASERAEEREQSRMERSLPRAHCFEDDRINTPSMVVSQSVSK